MGSGPADLGSNPRETTFITLLGYIFVHYCLLIDMNWFAGWGILGFFGILFVFSGDSSEMGFFVALIGCGLLLIAVIGAISTAIIRANHALMDSAVYTGISSPKEDIIVICPNCDSEVNVGTDEDDLYECPSCNQDFEF